MHNSYSPNWEVKSNYTMRYINLHDHKWVILINQTPISFWMSWGHSRLSAESAGWHHGKGQWTPPTWSMLLRIAERYSENFENTHSLSDNVAAGWHSAHSFSRCCMKWFAQWRYIWIKLIQVVWANGCWKFIFLIGNTLKLTFWVVFLITCKLKTYDL